MNCAICEQPTANCSRSKRKSNRFDVVVGDDFLNGQYVPCSFKQRLNQYVAGKWLVVRSTVSCNFDLYLQKEKLKTRIVGPYWLSLLRAYNIMHEDVVHFIANEDEWGPFNFHVTISHNNVEKLVVQQSGVPSRLRSILHKTIFSDINSITEQDMSAILFGIYKDVELEHEFYEPKDLKNFWVHKVDHDDISNEALYMPSQAVEGYRYPCFGTAHLYIEGQVLRGEEETNIECTYSIQWDLGHVCFNNGWTDFSAATGIGLGSLLLMKFEPMKEYIGLNFVEIINLSQRS